MKYIIIPIVLLVLLVSGCNETRERPIGGDKDEHGCLVAAGYQWCPSTQKCQRMWEEYCEEFKDQYKSENEISDFESCAKAGYPVMESYPRQCKAGDRTFVEKINTETIITSAELSEHDSPEDCWVAYERKVYDITDFIPKHKGDPTNIINSCGTSGEFELAMTSQHGTSKVSVLESEGVFKGNLDG